MGIDIGRVLEVVTSVQTEAAKIHLGESNVPADPSVILAEGAKDFTTAVDRAVEEHQKTALRKEFPEIGFRNKKTSPVK